jgi:co-chaperonin GroES (HSP10)
MAIGENLLVEQEPINAMDFMTDVPLTKYIPFGNRIIGKLVKDPEKEVILDSGIIMTSDKKSPYVECQVVKVGRGVTTNNGLVPCESKVGDIALLFNGKSYTLNDGDEKFIIFTEQDIVASYKPDAVPKQ